MPTTSPYYSLYLYNSTTDQTSTFLDFRSQIAGPSASSNMMKIDTALNTLAGQIVSLQQNRVIPVSATYISSNYYEASGISAITSYVTGTIIILKLNQTSNGTVTLNINGLGTKSVLKVTTAGATTNIAGNDLVANREYLLKYDGTQWIWITATSADQISISGTLGNIVTIGTGNVLSGSATVRPDTLAAPTDVTTNNATTGAHGLLPKLSGVSTEYLNGNGSWTEPLSLTEKLKGWTEGESYQLTSATLDSDGIITTASVLWPDGSLGTFTTTTKNATWLAIDAYTITHTTGSKTVTQTAVTRNADGNITAQPALTVT